MRTRFGNNKIMELTKQYLRSPAICSEVYPVTRADNPQDANKYDLKSRKLKKGCDTHCA